MRKQKHCKRMCLIWLIFGLILCMTGCNRPHSENGGENALADAQRELELFGIGLTGLVDSVEGESVEDFAYYCFHVCSGNTETLKTVLATSCCKMKDVRIYIFPE